jgi:hypothetical protein
MPQGVGRDSPSAQRGPVLCGVLHGQADTPDCRQYSATDDPLARCSRMIFRQRVGAELVVFMPPILSTQSHSV